MSGNRHTKLQVKLYDPPSIATGCTMEMTEDTERPEDDGLTLGKLLQELGSSTPELLSGVELDVEELQMIYDSMPGAAEQAVRLHILAGYLEVINVATNKVMFVFKL